MHSSRHPDPAAPGSLASAAELEPGLWVRLPARAEWGAGQVQSVVGNRVTVMFEHAGKVLVNLAAAALERLDGPP